ncbi:DUF4389 domain-containing protein [Nocardia sp. CC201C]|uniref:DUF4389 domain-containing protein n=1 Tax=Nocardia sp. CC201C TaxID=3044575 RepID=UPI0024A915E7|nr:DUF4389 domain-containing protein [Nocardia sp. CC201C]
MTGPENYPAPETGVPGKEPTVDLDIFPPEQHSRLTVLLRLLLIIPQAIVVWLLGLAAIVVVICGWFGALVLGRLPDWCTEFLRGYFSYTTRVYGYGMLLVDDYPPFAWNPTDYPVRVLFHAPTELNRLAVLFRLILAIPILIFASWLTTGWTVIAFFIWLIVLITGRMPQPVFEATAAVIRTQLRTSAYAYLLTPTYLKGPFGDGTQPTDPVLAAAQPPVASPTRPLWVSQGGKILLIVILVLGILASIGQSVAQPSYDDTDTVDTSQAD